MTTSDLLRETRVDGRPKRRKAGEKEQPKVRLVPDDANIPTEDSNVAPDDSNIELRQAPNIEQPVGERSSATDQTYSHQQDQSSEVDSEFPRLDDRYEVLSIIGKGGTGAVYKVLDKELDKIFAIKVLQSDLAGDQTALRRFEQEAEAASQLAHNNLVSVFGYGKTKDGAPYLVMDYFDGASLSAVLKEERTLESARALNVFHQISDALVHAHEQGVIHRDIKPANVIVSMTESGIETARIVDFGIAKILPVANRETHNLTETRQVFGSPHYMSPEHCLGFKMDERSDIYSLGCLMYEVLTGDPPFSVSDAIQVVIKHINEEPLPFSDDMSNDPIKRKLEGVVLKCLEKEQENRYQSVKEVIADLELIEAGKTPARYVRRRADKLEYTAGQITRAIVGTFLFVVYIGYTMGWFENIADDQIFGVAMLLACMVGSSLFASESVEIERSISDGKNSKTDWWSLILATSLATMCLSFLPIAVELSNATFHFYKMKPTWLLDALSACQLFHMLSIGSVFVGLAGRVLYSGAQKVKVYKVGLQYIGTAAVMICLSTWFAPAPLSVFTWFLSDSRIMKKYAPATSQQLLETSLNLDPLNQGALFDLVDVKLAQNKRDEAEQLFDNYFTRERAARPLAATHYKRAQMYEKASWKKLGELSKAIHFMPFLDYYVERAEEHVLRGEFYDAQKDFEEAIRCDPNSSTPYVGRAQIYAATRNFQIALNELNGIAAQKCGWTNPDVFFLRARLFEELNAPNLAERDYQQVVELLKQKQGYMSGYEALKAAYSYQTLKDTDNFVNALSLARKKGYNQKDLSEEFKKMQLPLDW